MGARFDARRLGRRGRARARVHVLARRARAHALVRGRSAARRTSTSWTRRGSCRSRRAAKRPRARGLSVGSRASCPCPRAPRIGAIGPPSGRRARPASSSAWRAETARGERSAARRTEVERGAAPGARQGPRHGDGARSTWRSAARESAALRRRGELLRASFHLLTPGRDARARARPHGGGAPEVEIELDPKRRTPGEQVAACFHEAERCERAEVGGRARGCPPRGSARPRSRRRQAAPRGVETPEALEALAAEVGLAGAGAVSARGLQRQKGRRRRIPGARSRRRTAGRSAWGRKRAATTG